MTAPEGLRAYALSLPEAAESTHFRLPAVTVGETVFVVFQEHERFALLSVPEADATAAVAEDPQAFAVVRRNGGRIFVGVRVDLAAAPEGRVRDLVERAWRHKAPRRVVAALDART